MWRKLNSSLCGVDENRVALETGTIGVAGGCCGGGSGQGS